MEDCQRAMNNRKTSYDPNANLRDLLPLCREVLEQVSEGSPAGALGVSRDCVCLGSSSSTRGKKVSSGEQVNLTDPSCKG